MTSYVPGTIQIAPSILAADFGQLGDEIKAAEAGGADLIHVDVMDGHFVPNISLGPVVVQGIRPVTKLELDVHLMIESPWEYLEAFAKAGADSITVHVEACPDPADTIGKIHGLGKRAGIVMSPDTPVDAVEPFLDLVERVLVMSVHPGFGGQSFIPEALAKTETLSRWRSERGLAYDIEIDGGIKEANSHEVAEKGAETLVSGSGIFGGDDYGQRISAMRAAAESGLAAR
ncbi:MAG: ribulose-phosphate 3-epimerase [Candidatus Binatia bacterium]|nr:ribulose-phosphate 3-epimerase [Candidatus Binatia bacterium]